MLHGSLLDKILLFALPLAASMMLQQLFNSADVAVVGRFDSPQAMAAVGSNGAAINLMVNLFVGLSIGANVIVAQCIGRNDTAKIHDAVHTSISLALIGGGILLVWGLAMARTILTLMNTPADIIELAVVYFRISITYFLPSMRPPIRKVKGASSVIRLRMIINELITFDMTVARATPTTLILNPTTNITFRITFTTPPTARAINGLLLSPLLRRTAEPKLYSIMNGVPTK